MRSVSVVILLIALIYLSTTAVRAEFEFRGLGAFSSATAVNADGSVVVGQSSATAFRWTQAGGIVSLGALAGGRFFSSSAQDVNADGSVVVGRSSGASAPAGTVQMSRSPAVCVQ